MNEEVKQWYYKIYTKGKSILIFTFIVLLTIIGFKLAYFYLPFLIAFTISLIIEPIIKKLMKKFKISRKFSSIIVLIFTLGIIIGFLSWIIITLISESSNLLSNFNVYYEKISSGIGKWLNNTNIESFKVPSEIIDLIRKSAFSMLEKVSIYFQNIFTQIVSSVKAIPVISINIFITFLSLYFICTDKIYMIDELEHHLPEKWMRKLSKHIRELVKSLGGYLKAQVFLIIISFFISLIGLYILHFLKFNVGFPLIAAILIAFVDALPIFGSGTVMIPWGIISGLNGELTLGLSIIALWIIMSLVRQFIEPKIVSGNIGIHPIFTIISMYTGFRFIGIMGMFVGPIVLIIIKNIFSKFIDRGIVKAIFDMK